VTRAPWHALAWLAWALAGAVSVELAPSPLYVAVVIGVAALVVQVHGAGGPFARAFPVLVTLGVVFAVVRVVLTAVTTHGGLGPVLFTTPSFTLPRLLGGFTVGGPIELEIVLQAAAEGFVVVGIMAVFGAFNAVVSHYELVQSTPRAFYELGLVVTVALAFVPATLRAIGAVRESDRARTGGRVVRRGRLVRQVLPVLESGMERAVSLAESMDSRGFAHGGASSLDRAAGWAGLGALVLLGGAFVALVGRASAVALACGVAGTAALVVAIAAASASRRRTRYRPRAFTPADAVMAGASIAGPVLLAVLATLGEPALRWSASPLGWPEFAAWPLVALGALLAPLARLPRPAPVAAPEPVPELATP
jgi:energy-coupling factor transport system permease protein